MKEKYDEKINKKTDLRFSAMRIPNLDDRAKMSSFFIHTYNDNRGVNPKHPYFCIRCAKFRFILCKWYICLPNIIASRQNQNKWPFLLRQELPRMLSH